MTHNPVNAEIDELLTLRMIIETLPRNIHGEQWYLAVDAAYLDVQQEIDRMISEREGKT